MINGGGGGDGKRRQDFKGGWHYASTTQAMFEVAEIMVHLFTWFPSLIKLWLEDSHDVWFCWSYGQQENLPSNLAEIMVKQGRALAQNKTLGNSEWCFSILLERWFNETCDLASRETLGISSVFRVSILLKKTSFNNTCYSAKKLGNLRAGLFLYCWKCVSMKYMNHSFTNEWIH